MSCNKMSFTTKKDASDENKYRRNCANETTNKKLKPYLCDDCGSWHLTSTKRLKHHRRKPRKEAVL